jgi:hypothetical protein
MYCPVNASGDVLTIIYSYIPSKLVATSLSNVPLINCDHTVFCFYAAYLYQVTNNNPNAGDFLDNFNDAYNEISASKGHSRRVGGTR